MDAPTILNNMKKSLLQKTEDELGGNIIEPGYCGSVVKNEELESVLRRVVNSIKNILRPLYRPCRHSVISTICMLRKDYQGIIYVDPLEIKNTVNKNDPTLKRNDMWHFGSVCDGDWDLDGAPIQEYGYIYPILKQRVEQGKDYNDIPEFMENLKLIDQGERPDVCSSEKQYREKWCRIEIVYNLLKEEGYKSQKELKTGYPFNEIRVQVGRFGDLLFEEGMHRLVISQLLGFKKIPVIVTRRHAEWVKRNGKKVHKNAK